jgi:hypothetical protein
VLRKNAFTLALLAAILALLLLYFRSEVGRGSPNPPPTPTPASTSAADSKLKTQNSKLLSETPPPALSAARSELADTLNSPTTTLPSDLRVVLEILAAFRSNFPRTGNPVGSNAEITAALTGRNPLHLALIPRDHPAINAAGELCDRYGTPFFFHAESGTHMDIRSAGPDKKMWTSDDVILAP